MSFTPACPGTYGPGPLLIERPVVVPWGFGLKSVATIIDETNDHARNGIVYKSPPCTADVQPWVDNCIPDDLMIKMPTDADTNSIVRGCPFHLYTALSCKTTTLEEMLPAAQAIFNLGEQRAVEQQVWANVLAQPGTAVLNPAGTDSDGYAAFTAKGGLAALESHIAQCYGGVATMHADRGVMAFLADGHEVVPCGDICQEPNTAHQRTRLGTKFAFYGGSPNTSPDGTPAGAGFAWIYVTSELTLRRFPVAIHPESVDQRLRYNPLTNEPYIVVERTYVPSIECCAAAVLVCLNGGCS